jgi:hypothetical protein
MGFFREMMAAFGVPVPPRQPLARADAPSPAAVGVAGQVIHCSVQATADSPRYPTLSAARAGTDMLGFVPACLVAQKAKTVVDGILAALEGLSTEGTAACMGVDAFLAALGERLGPGEPSREIIDAASDLAAGVSSPRFDTRSFLSEPLRSKPLGFYTWSEDLVCAFRRDRFLQRELRNAEAQTMWCAIEKDEFLRATYGHHLRRIVRLTNPFGPLPLGDSNRHLSDGHRHRAPSATEMMAIIPACVAPENAYPSILDFFGAVRAGTCKLEPTAHSGFYAHQLRALDPLLCPGAFPEARARMIDANYAAELEQFAAASLFATCESHVKQLEIPAPVASPLSALTRWIYPSIKIEPLPSYYAFVADSLRFLRTVIDEGWGPDALDAMQRRPSGPIDATLAQGIEEVIDICEAAARLSRRELAGEASSSEVAALRTRLFALWDDPDATGDIRGMVPLGMTDDFRLRVLVLAGWEVQGIAITFASIPGVPPDVGLGIAQYPLPVPIVRESLIAPGGVLDREEVRRLCDEALARRTAESA